MKFLLLVLAFASMSAFGVVCKDKKYVDVGSNEVQVVKAVYDFSNDKGAIASYELAEATGDLILDNISISGLTAATTGDGATVDLGYTGAGTAFLAATGTATLEAGDFTIPAETFVQTKIAKGAKILMEIKTGTLTAGKFVVTMVFRKFGL